MTEDKGAFTCTQCPKIFATRSNLKRHMENPNIHNEPYARCRDQKRWKDHSKKVSSRQETTERMRKWRAENRDKNKRNDLRCRVYRLARQKFGEEDSQEKHQFIENEIKRRLDRRMLLEQKNKEAATAKATSKAKKSQTTMIKDELDKEEHNTHARTSLITPPGATETLNELPFYCAPRHKIELPSINLQNRSPSQNNTEPSGYSNKSQSHSPMSESTTFQEDETRRHSGCSAHSSYSNRSGSIGSNNNASPATNFTEDAHHTENVASQRLFENNMALPPMQSCLPFVVHINPSPATDDNPPNSFHST